MKSLGIMLARMIDSTVRAAKHAARMLIISVLIWNIPWGVTALLAPSIDRSVRGASAIVYPTTEHTWQFYAVWYAVTFVASFFIGRIARSGGWLYAGMWGLLMPNWTKSFLGIDGNTMFAVNFLFMSVSALGGLLGQRFLIKKPVRQSARPVVARRAQSR